MAHHSPQSGSKLHPISLRPMRRVDRAIVFGTSFARWETVELEGGLDAEKMSAEHEFIDLVAEKNCQIVGWMRASRTSLRSDLVGLQAKRALQQAWWMQTDGGWPGAAGLELNPQGDTLLGLGAGLLARLHDSPAEHARVLATMYAFGRSLLVRERGLSRWIASVPLSNPASWQHIYSPAGYVQQVEAGALEDRILSQHLRHDARVLQVLEPQTSAWILWDNPVR